MTDLTRRRFLALTAASTVVAGCTDIAADTSPVVHAPGSSPATTTPRRTPKPATSPPPAPPPAKLQANELGQLPVLMHHRLVTSSAGAYDQTPDFFRQELERLYRENYHPVRAIDLARRDLTAVPAGKTPVVLTFDDSTPSQVAFDSAGRVESDCALGILRGFHARHPDFPAVATFYVNRNPFGLSGAAVPQALVRLTALGCEIGNHTWSHPNLHTLSRAEAEAEIGKLAAMVRGATPASPCGTLALPLGVHPRDSSVLARGGRGSTAYRNLAVLLVGANPSLSPYHRDFDPMAIPRIRCSSHRNGRGPLEFNYWLDQLATRPGLKYIAAGNPAHVTAPSSLRQSLAPGLADRAIWWN
ncbi:polysaccharide deacetylase family protein [Kribbella sp. CA-293567]|uniref:polysaccharide deacetylase family protein n=1 Tax=Kribbella sp. CA-293567 TaxID=3002436 RepID=UPI0022DDFF9C|nr:polysaccharide deacetylase family protein [Kribbella sp. CA-293567]WBQ03502.1 polysaccharide deacetylase family protein [Kribbella sp. CA-293567]